MIVVIAEEGGVGNHDRGVSLLPKRPVIGPSDTGDAAWRSETFGRELRGLPKISNRFPNQGT
jgi:hypothetical protein